MKTAALLLFAFLMPLFLPRLMMSVVIPILLKAPLRANLPPTTPIEPVIVPGSAKMRSAPMAM